MSVADARRPPDLRGAASLIVAGAGLALARDFFDRLHFSAPATLGTILIVAALSAREGPSLSA